MFKKQTRVFFLPQKLHVRTVPLHEQPRRIAHQESSRTFLVTITQAMLGKLSFHFLTWILV